MHEFFKLQMKKIKEDIDFILPQMTPNSITTSSSKEIY